QGDNYVPEVSCSPSGCTTSHPRPASQIVKTASFEPIGYDLRLSGGDSCISFLRGETGSAEMMLRNRGAAGSFDVRVVGPDTQLMAYASRDYVSLARGGSEGLKAYFRAEPEAEEGRHFATIQFIHGADVVAEKDLCVQIKDRHEAKVTAPRSAQVNPERATSLQFEVENLGTSRESFAVSLLGVPGGVEISPQGFSLEPGETKAVDVIFSPGALKAQTSTLEFLVDSDYSHGRASVEITRAEQVPYPGIFAGNTTESGGAFTFEVIVKNGQPFDIDNVSFEVQGLPAGWESTVPSTTDIPAGKQARVPVVIRPGSDAQAASLVLVVKQNGREIGRQKLPIVTGAASGISGFLTLGTASGMWLIILILLLAVIVILMAARIRKDVRKAETEHLAALMHEVDSADGGQHEDHAFHASFAESLHSINREAGK
ncbi:MAG: NEW3 domain-containing protein, partial [Candidatus Micrarchaeota archaeon]